MSVKEFGLLQSTHPETMKTLTLAESIANSPVPVVICGDSGVGKTALALEIIKRSGAFSELRTWEQMKASQIERSPKRFTILLEEVDKLSLDEQEYLNKILEPLLIEKKVRLVSTCSQSLKKLCDGGYFRRDLYFKVCVVQLGLSSLRDRAEDIRHLAQHFLESSMIVFGKKDLAFTQEALTRLCSYHWPFNVLELQNVVERLVATTEGKYIQSEELYFLESQDISHGITKIEMIGITLSEMEKKLILQTLEMTQQNRTKAAQILGISIRTLRNKLSEYREAGAQ